MRCTVTLRQTLIIAGFVTCWLTVGQLLAPDAQARPAYKGVFEKLYAKVAKNQKISCAVCHPKKSKKVRNHYAEALGEEVASNEKDKKKIEDAMRAIEDEACPDGGKTWGERLEKGSVPCPHGSSKRLHSSVPSYIERLLAAPEIE